MPTPSDPEPEPTPDELDIHRQPSSVRAVYDRIAAQFAATRATTWPEVETFLETRQGATGLDLGAGNGRHAAVLATRVRQCLAVDLSRELLGETRERAPAGAAVQGTADQLGLAASSVDLALYIATVHHLPDRDRRIASLAELARVLAPGRPALVSAWSTTHDRFDASAGFDTTVPWTLPDGETVPRFYHIYAPAEFADDLAASPLSVVETWVSSGNCYAVVEG